VAYVNSLFPADVILAIADRKPTQMIGVPLFFKMLRGEIERRARARSRLERTWFTFAYRFIARIPLQALRRRVFKPVHDGLGGRLKHFYCGGAALDHDTEVFFTRLGLPIYPGYGLTETSPVISMQSTHRRRIGTVGKPLPGVEVRIAEDGEVLTRGPHVMVGYFGDDELTRKRIDVDGWLHTGDLGRLDRRGYLTITGRHKNTIVLGSGKKVQPEEVEDRIPKSPLIAELCVVGVPAAEGMKHGYEEVGCVVVPSDNVLEQHGDDPEAMLRLVKSELRSLTRTLAPHKRPTVLFIEREPLPTTATRKIKRAEIKNRVMAERTR
jgi:long-chain acyl-CoA synthetase